MNEWIVCQHCEAEFKVLSDVLAEIQYCPFCASEIEHDVDEDLWDDDV